MLTNVNYDFNQAGKTFIYNNPIDKLSGENIEEGNKAAGEVEPTLDSSLEEEMFST